MREPKIPKPKKVKIHKAPAFSHSPKKKVKRYNVAKALSE